jgi:hypothetical protein
MFQVGPDRGNNLIRIYKIDPQNFGSVSNEYLLAHNGISEFQAEFLNDIDRIVVFMRNFEYRALTFSEEPFDVVE